LALCGRIALIVAWVSALPVMLLVLLPLVTQLFPAIEPRSIVKWLGLPYGPVAVVLLFFLACIVTGIADWLRERALKDLATPSSCYECGYRVRHVSAACSECGSAPLRLVIAPHRAGRPSILRCGPRALVGAVTRTLRAAATPNDLATIVSLSTACVLIPVLPTLLIGRTHLPLVAAFGTFVALGMLGVLTARHLELRGRAITP
jgi:hypothetical protein